MTELRRSLILLVAVTRAEDAQRSTVDPEMPHSALSSYTGSTTAHSSLVDCQSKQEEPVVVNVKRTVLLASLYGNKMLASLIYASIGYML